MGSKKLDQLMNNNSNGLKAQYNLLDHTRIFIFLRKRKGNEMEISREEKDMKRENDIYMV